jgi:flavin reductase (DIM6/NTAB) family NADH-FMN oxidoreductase RutF/DNA-binding IclR family transcriptional regulator
MAGTEECRMTLPSSRAADSAHFRNVLSQLPAGVVVVTAAGVDGAATGMTVSSFTSVSLDPPLVAFMPQVNSSAWRKIADSGSFCVNVLTHAQEHFCRAMAASSEDKFTGINWDPAPSGSPVLEQVAAWIDCDIESVFTVGDHYIVIGRVRDLDVAESTLPLIFYQGGYGSFSPSTLAANDADLIEQLAVVDVARAHMNELSTKLEVECLAIARVDAEVVVIASSGAPRTGRRLTRVGTRVPFCPPGGYVFAAWSDDVSVEAWLGRHARAGHPRDLHDHRRRLALIRQRGFSLGLGGSAHHDFGSAVRSLGRAPGNDPMGMTRLLSQLADDYEPDDLTAAASHRIRTMTAPIFGADGSIVLALVLYGLREATTPAPMAQLTQALLQATGTVTSAIGGAAPKTPLAP